MNRDEPRRISPDMGPGGPEVDPEREALAWAIDEGLVWDEDLGWVHPDDAGDDAQPATWDEVGWDRHPEYEEPATLGYWNPVEATPGGWFLAYIPGRYRWTHHESGEGGELTAVDHADAFWQLVELADPYATIETVATPFSDVAIPGMLNMLADRFRALGGNGTVSVNGTIWRRQRETWQVERKADQRRAGGAGGDPAQSS